MPSSFIREEGYRAVMLMRAGPVGANHTAVLSVRARSMSSHCFFGMPRSTVSTFKSSRRSKATRLDPRRQWLLAIAKSSRSFRNIAKIIIPMITKFAEILLVLTFFSVSVTAYEETNGDVPFCHVPDVPVYRLLT